MAEYNPNQMLAGSDAATESRVEGKREDAEQVYNEASGAAQQIDPQASIGRLRAMKPQAQAQPQPQQAQPQQPQQPQPPAQGSISDPQASISRLRAMSEPQEPQGGQGSTHREQGGGEGVGTGVGTVPPQPQNEPPKPTKGSGRYVAVVEDDLDEINRPQPSLYNSSTDRNGNTLVHQGGFTYVISPDKSQWKYYSAGGEWRPVSYTATNGDVTMYNNDGSVNRVIEAPHIPHVGDRGATVYWTNDPNHPWIGGSDLADYWEKHKSDMPKVSNDYRSMSADALSGEVRRLINMSNQYAQGSPEYNECVSLYRDAALELLAKYSGFSNYSQAASNPGQFDYVRFKNKIAQAYPCDLSGALLNKSILNNPYINSPHLVFAHELAGIGSMQANDAFSGREREGSFYTNLVNNSKENLNRFVTLCAGKALMTNRRIDDVINEEWRKMSWMLNDASEELLNERVRDYIDTTPSWLMWSTSTLDNTIVGGAVESLILNKEERHRFGMAAQQYRREQGTMSALASEGVGLFVDYPIYHFSGVGVSGLIGRSGMQLAAGRVLHGALTFSGVNLVGMGVNDLKVGQFSGVDQYVTSILEGGLSGATMGVFGELARPMFVRPVSYKGTIWNKAVDYTAKTVGFTLPGWVTAAYSGRTPEGEPVSGEWMAKYALHNFGVVVAMEGFNNLKGWKPRVTTNDLSQLNSYPDLRDAITYNLDRINRGEAPAPLEGRALEQMNRLQGDMNTYGKGISWQAYSNVMEACGYYVVPPAPNSVSRDGQTVRVFDANGKVIAENRYKSSSEAKKGEKDLQQSIAKDEEERNGMRYYIGREAHLDYEACAELADRRSDNKEWRKKNADGTFMVDEAGNYVKDENFRCTTPDEIQAELKAALNTPEETRTPEQRQLISDFDQVRGGLASNIPDVDQLAQMICEQYGITMEALAEAAEKAPGERDANSPATKAMSVYNEILSRGMLMYKAPVGEVILTDGGKIEVYNEANLNDKTGVFFYKDAEGKTQMLSASDKRIQGYEPIVNERERRFDVSNENIVDGFNSVLEKYRNVFQSYEDDFLNHEIERLLEKNGLTVDENGNLAAKNGEGEEVVVDEGDLIELGVMLQVRQDRQEHTFQMGATDKQRAAQLAEIQAKKENLEGSALADRIDELTKYYIEHPLELQNEWQVEGALSNESKVSNESKEGDKQTEGEGNDISDKESARREYAELDAQRKENKATLAELHKENEQIQRELAKLRKEGASQEEIEEKLRSLNNNLQRMGAVQENIDLSIQRQEELKKIMEEADNVPPTDDNVPPASEEIPPTDNVPPAEESAPPAEGVPPAEDNVPPANDGVPPAEEVALPTQHTEQSQIGGERKPTEVDALTRAKAEAFVDAYYPELKDKPEAREEMIQNEIARGDFENTVRFDKEDGVNKAKTDAYDAAVRAHEEGERRRTEEEAARRREEESKRQEEEKKRQEEESRRKAEEEAAKRREEEEKRKAEEEKKKAEAERDRKIEEIIEEKGKDFPEEGKDMLREMYRNDEKRLEEDYRKIVGEKKPPVKEEPPKEEPPREEPPKEEPPREEPPKEEPPREERPKEEERRPEEPERKEPIDDLETPIPTVKTKGGEEELDFSATTPRRGAHYIYNESGLPKDVADQTVANGITSADNAIKAHAKKEPQAPKKPSQIPSYNKKHAEWEQEGERLAAEKRYWEEVQRIADITDDINEIDEAKSFTSRRDVFNRLRQKYAKDPEMRGYLSGPYVPQTLYDACMDFLASGARFVWNGKGNKKGLAQQQGWGEGERKSAISMIANEENGGITPDQAVHRIVDLYGQDLHIDLDRSQDILNPLLQAIKDTGTRGNASDYIREKRLADVRDALVRRRDGEGRSSYDEISDRRAEEELQGFREDHPEYANASDKEVADALIEKSRRENPAPVEPTSDESPFTPSSGDVPFQAGETAAPAKAVSRQARRFTARVLNKLRKAGVRVKVATQEEAQRMRELYARMGAEFQAVFHGSANDFDAFDHSHMGEGEGHQAFGYGTYVTGVEGIAKHYATQSAINKRFSKTPGYGNYDHYWKGQKIDLSTINPLRMAYDIVQREGTIKKAIAQVERFIDNPEAHEGWGEALEILRQSRKSDFTRKRANYEGERFLYEVEIPDNDGTNYLSWVEPLTDEQLERIALAGRQSKEFAENFDLRNDPLAWAKVNEKSRRGDNVYSTLSNTLGARKASELLSQAGFVGIEYPAQFRSGGRGDNAKNYVIFNEADAKITNKTEFLVTKDGKVYGWHDSEGIHLTKDGFNPDTPAHEYTHGFMRMLKENDPKTYRRVVEGLKQSEVWEEVLKDPAYENIRGDEDAVASEVAARLSGRENASRVNTEFDFSKGNIFSAANAVALGARAKNALRDLWDRVQIWLGGRKDELIPADQAARMVLRALDKGVNPDAVAEGADPEFSLREKPKPKKTIKVYKLMRLGDDGKLYPLFIDGGEPIELGRWYDADSPDMDMLVDLPVGVHLIDTENGTSMTMEEYYKQNGLKLKNRQKYPSKEIVESTPNGQRWVFIEPTDRAQRRFGGESRRYWNIGINGSGSVSTFSMRPGWHAGSLPTMRQIGKGANRDLRDDRFVWVEGEISADIDYNGEAQLNPDNDIPTHIPTDGYYMKATNANAKASQADRVGWYISGAFKANRIMSDYEARKVIDDWNAGHPDVQVEHDFPRESGKVFNAETMRLENDERVTAASKFSVMQGDENLENIGRSDRKDVPLRERTRKSYTRRDGTYVEGLEEELQRLEEEQRKADEEIGEVDSQREGGTSRIQSNEQESRYGEAGLIDDIYNQVSLTNRISLIRRELASRDRTREEYKKKYDIADNGDISIENVAKMFRDFNSDEAVGKLFEKVYNVLKVLRNDFRVSDNVSPLNKGTAAEYLKMAFYSWDALVRGRDAQGKAKTLLHEMIHNAATHVISSYEDPLLRMLLSPSQKRAAKTLIDIYEKIRVEDLRDSNGKRFYGLKSANEMIAELANPEFRKALKNIEYNSRSLWQRVKDAIKKIFGLDVPAREGNALDEASKALDEILESYGGVNTVIRNIPRASYNIIQRTKGRDSVDVVESKLDENSRRLKNEEEESSSRDFDAELRDLYRRGLFEGYNAVKDDIARVRAEKEAALNSGEGSGESGEAPAAEPLAAGGGGATPPTPPTNPPRPSNPPTPHANPPRPTPPSGGNPPRPPRGGNTPPPSGSGINDPNLTPQDRSIARDEYERTMRRSSFQVTEALQDSMLSLKKLMESIIRNGSKKVRFRIENIAGYENPYLAENRMSSMNNAQHHYFYVNHMKPLFAAISGLTGGKKGARQELTNYMMAKHGLERNEKLAERDARAAADKGADFQTEYQNNRQRDYSGLTALTGKADVADAEAEARQMVADYESRHDTTELWQRVNEANRATLDKMLESGLLSQDRYNSITQMFDNYIPLQGWDEKTNRDVYEFLTSHDGPLGSPIKMAKGRTSKADDPIAVMWQMSDQAIQEGNRNLMKQTFLNFVRNHPSDAVSLSDLWLKHNDVNDTWEPVFADLKPDDTPAEVERKTRDFEQKMEQLAQQYPDRYKHGEDAENIPYKVVPGSIGEHQVVVKENGRSYIITINGNPRAAQALNGKTNPDHPQSGWAEGLLNGVMRFNRGLSFLYTSANPAFVASNYVRDAVYSNSMAWAVKDSPNYAARFSYEWGKMNPVYMRKLYHDWQNGTLDTSKKYGKLFEEFMLNGGETGFMSSKEIEIYKRDIKKEVRRAGNSGRKIMHILGRQLEMANRAVENNARFAAFCASRGMGRSLERSIYDAKEVSVNFNKKGAGSRFFRAEGQTAAGNTAAFVSGAGRALYVFWNPAIQGLTNMGRAYRRAPVRGLMHAASLFGLGLAAPYLNMYAPWVDDEDREEYYNMPEYVRRSNLVIPLGDKKFLTIPLPIEMRAIYGLGELAMGVISGNDRYSDKDLAFNIASQVSQILPLDMLEGGGGIHPFIPSVAKPVFEAAQNRGWTGIPIYREPTQWDEYKPDWTRAYSSANAWLVKGAKWLNEYTGGDDFTKGWLDINPAQIEYVLRGYGGGWWEVVDKLGKMAETQWGDRDFDWSSMLVANRFVKQANDRTEMRKINNEFFRYKEEHDKTKMRLDDYNKAANGDSKEDAVKYAERMAFLNGSEEYGRYLIFENHKKELDQLNDLRKDLEDGNIPESFRKEYEDLERNLRRTIVQEIHDFEDGKYKPQRPTTQEMLKPKDIERKQRLTRSASSLQEYRDISTFISTNTGFQSNNNHTVKGISDLGAKVTFTKRKGGKTYELGLEGSHWNLNGQKSAEKKRYYKEHKEELDRVARNRWRNREIDRLLDDMDEHPEKAEENWKKIHQLIQDDKKDEAEYRNKASSNK